MRCTTARTEDDRKKKELYGLCGLRDLARHLADAAISKVSLGVLRCFLRPSGATLVALVLAAQARLPDVRVERPVAAVPSSCCATAGGAHLLLVHRAAGARLRDARVRVDGRIAAARRSCLDAGSTVGRRGGRAVGRGGCRAGGRPVRVRLGAVPRRSRRCVRVVRSEGIVRGRSVRSVCRRVVARRRCTVCARSSSTRRPPSHPMSHPRILFPPARRSASGSKCSRQSAIDHLGDDERPNPDGHKRTALPAARLLASLGSGDRDGAVAEA